LRPPKNGKHRSELEDWVLDRIELVSLLKHEQPVVYINRHQPRMEDAATAKTRKLDRFQAAALKKLYAGEDVVIASKLNHLTMVGSVRASRQCVQSHSVERGHLLGAFSYQLVRTPQLTTRANSK